MKKFNTFSKLKIRMENTMIYRNVDTDIRITSLKWKIKEPIMTFTLQCLKVFIAEFWSDYIDEGYYTFL